MESDSDLDLEDILKKNGKTALTTPVTLTVVLIGFSRSEQLFRLIASYASPSHSETLVPSKNYHVLKTNLFNLQATFVITPPLTQSGFCQNAARYVLGIVKQALSVVDHDYQQHGFVVLTQEYDYMYPKLIHTLHLAGLSKFLLPLTYDDTNNDDMLELIPPLREHERARLWQRLLAMSKNKVQASGLGDGNVILTVRLTSKASEHLTSQKISDLQEDCIKHGLELKVGNESESQLYVGTEEEFGEMSQNNTGDSLILLVGSGEKKQGVYHLKSYDKITPNWLTNIQSHIDMTNTTREVRELTQTSYDDFVYECFLLSFPDFPLKLISKGQAEMTKNFGKVGAYYYMQEVYNAGAISPIEMHALGWAASDPKQWPLLRYNMERMRKDELKATLENLKHGPAAYIFDNSIEELERHANLHGHIIVENKNILRHTRDCARNKNKAYLIVETIKLGCRGVLDNMDPKELSTKINEISRRVQKIDAILYK